MFEVKMDADNLKLVHSSEGHEYTFPIRRDADGARSLGDGFMAQNHMAKTSASRYASYARQYAEAIVITGKETRAIVLWYLDETNTNLKDIERLLEGGWLIESFSTLSPVDAATHVKQSRSNSFWKKWSGHERQHIPRYSRTLVVMREPRDYEEVVRVNGHRQLYYAFAFSFSDEQNTNLQELNSRLNDRWTIVFVMPLSEPTYAPENGTFSTSRALVMLRTNALVYPPYHVEN